MALNLVRNDITRMEADAIVNPANPEPVIGGGTDSAIHRAAGPELLRARQDVGRIACGTAAVTPAFGLKARYVIHTVSPAWSGGGHGEEALLRRAYDSALGLALERGCRSVAIPLLSAGTLGFPTDLALSVAVRACQDFLLQHRLHIDLVVFHPRAYELSRQLRDDVHSFIDEHEAEEMGRREYGGVYCRRQRRMELCRAECLPESGSQPEEQNSLRLREALAQRLGETHETFTQAMLRIIREQNLLDPEVYGRILMDRKTFNKIKNAPDHHPQRKTAIQLAIALRLNEDQARDLIGRAGYAFTESSRADLILLYFIRRGIYDIDVIDAALVEFGEKALFTAA